MQVTARLRNDFQHANTIEKAEAVLTEIVEQGPLSGNRTGVLQEMNIPVPSGPVEHW
jgi:hypothetical protein